MAASTTITSNTKEETETHPTTHGLPFFVANHDNNQAQMVYQNMQENLTISVPFFMRSMEADMDDLEQLLLETKSSTILSDMNQTSGIFFQQQQQQHVQSNMPPPPPPDIKEAENNQQQVPSASLLPQREPTSWQQLSWRSNVSFNAPPVAARVPDGGRVGKEPPVMVPGQSRKTWTFVRPDLIRRVHLLAASPGRGRPLDAQMDFWQGPHRRVPQKFRVRVEDGRARPVQVILETPTTDSPQAIAIRNLATTNPLLATVEAECDEVGEQQVLTAAIQALTDAGIPKLLPGDGAVFSKSFDSSVTSLRVLIRSNGRPIHARMELFQGGPDNLKQVMDFYSENGQVHPFFAILETPGGQGSLLRIVNVAPLEFSFYITAEPY